MCLSIFSVSETSFFHLFLLFFHVFVIYNNREKINEMEKEIDWQVGWNSINLDSKQHCEAICCLSLRLQLRTHIPDYTTPSFGGGRGSSLVSLDTPWGGVEEEPYNF